LESFTEKGMSRMRQAWRTLAGVLAVGAFAGGSPALADDGSGRGGDRGDRAPATFGPSALFTIDPATNAQGNPEGVAFDRRSGAFFVSRVGSGAIFRGTLDDPVVHPFIGPMPNPEGTAPPLATGLKVRHGKLYVAGARTGTVRIYDLDAPAAAPTVIDVRGADKTSPSFVNDLAVTGDGDVFATDSFRPAIYRIDGDTHAVTTIDVSARIPLVRNPDGSPAFNLNGIVARGDGDLIVVQSATSKLFRIDLDGDDDRRGDGRDDDDRRGDGDRRGRAAQATPDIDQIRLTGGTINGGDGLLVDRGRLIVVQGSNPAVENSANGVLTFITLRRHRTRGEVVANRTHPNLRSPSTAVRARDRYLVANADFGLNRQPYTVASLDRGRGGR
jgi:sugar lactone lactonase YvrE